MPPKRTKSASSGVGKDNKWEQTLMNAVFCEKDLWQATIVFITANKLEDVPHLKVLTEAVAGGTRRLFSVISRHELYAQIESGPKAAKAKKDTGPGGIPEIYDKCKPFLENDGDIPAPLLANLVKHELLEIKTKDMTRRDMLRKDTGGRTSKPGSAMDKVGKKGAKGADRVKSAGKGKSGKKTPETGKVGTKLKKRGDDEVLIKYIDDEPDNGPEHYILVIGFPYATLFSSLIDIGIDVDCILKVESEDYPASESTVPADDDNVEKDEKQLVVEEAHKFEKARGKQELKRFWKDILPLLQTDSKLHDIARLTYKVKSSIVPEHMEENEKRQQFGTLLFEDVACLVYDLLDSKRQWQNFLRHLQLIHVPQHKRELFSSNVDVQSLHSVGAGKPAGGAAAPQGGATGAAAEKPAETASQAENDVTTEPDMRYYNDLINTIPVESASLPLIMHCMLEQVVASEEDKEIASETPKPPRADGLEDSIAQHVSSAVYRLALSQNERQLLADEFDQPKTYTTPFTGPVLIHHHDDTTRRLNHLKPIDGFDARKVEMEMAAFHPAANIHLMPSQETKTSKERMARLQELLSFISFSRLNQAEVDQAFRQFVLEYMDITEVDAEGNIVPPGKSSQRDIPWDDPYPFYSLMIPQQDVEVEVEEFSCFSRQSGSRSAETLPISASWEEGLDDLSLDGSATRLARGSAKGSGRGSGRGSAKGSARGSARQSRSTKKKSRCSSAKEPTPPQLLSTVSIMSPLPPVSNPTSRTVSPASGMRMDLPDVSMQSVHFKDASTRSIEVNATGPVNASGPVNYGNVNIPGKWANLDQWCFVEHMEPHILQQVLNSALYTHPVMDTYYNKRDHVLMVTLHNPHNQQLQNCVSWKTYLHSDVGFRNYLEHVAQLVSTWTQEQEVKYQAQLLQWETEKKLKELSAAAAKAAEESSRPNSAQSKRKGRSSSPKKSLSCGSSSERSLNRNMYVRAGSIKASNLEAEKLRAEEEDKEQSKEGRKSAGKKPKEKEEKEPKEKKRANSRGSARSKSVTKEDVQVPMPSPQMKPPHTLPFMGYDLGDALLHLSGTVTNLFPADGGQVRVEKTEFTQGTVSIRASVLKDGHVFSIHILNPKQPGEEDEDESLLPPNPSKNEVGQEKSETERSEKEELSSRVPTTLLTTPVPDGTVEGSHLDPPDIVIQPVPEKKPCVGSFGSFSAVLSDGMTLSLSIYGDVGEPGDGTPLLQEAPTPPPPESPSVASKEVPPPAKTKGKGEKGEKQEKGGKAEKGDKGKEKPQPSPEPAPSQPEEELLKLDETVEQKVTVDLPLQQLHIACPDGLVVTFHPETNFGIVPDDPEKPMLVVRQTYPMKTRGLQECEVSRFKLMDEASRVITSRGTVIKTMTDGRAEVLFASGAVSQLVQNSTLVPCSAHNRNDESPTRAASPNKGGRETPSKKPAAGKRRSAEKKRQADTQPDTQTAAPVDEEPPEPKWHWITTTPSGERIVTKQHEDTNIPVPPALVSKASDPSTHQTMFSREDSVVMVTHPSGATVVEHADGTRISTYFKEMQIPVENTEQETETETEDAPPPVSQTTLVMFVQVECPGYATVLFNTKQGDCQVQFGNGTAVNTAMDGSSDIYHHDGGYIRIDENGAAIYYPKPNRHIEVIDPNHQQVYLMKHYDELILETVDNEGNKFNVAHTGDTSVTVSDGGQLDSHESDVNVAASDASSVDLTTTLAKNMIMYKQHAPRFFVIQPDGGGVELLRYQDVAEYIAAAEDDPLTAILMDPLPDFPSVTGITVLKPYTKDVSQKWLLPYAKKSIIPEGLVSRDLETLPARERPVPGLPFGTTVGRGLAIGNVVRKPAVPPVVQCPRMLEVRQLLQYKPVSQELRYHLSSCLRRYCESVLGRQARAEGLLPVDPRSEGEKILAEDLRNRLPPVEQAVSSDSSVDYIEIKGSHPVLPFTEVASQVKGDVKALYEKVTAVPPPSPPPTPQLKRCKADWERFQREFEEVLEAKKLLKEKKVPSYFESALGKAFLLSQAPDLAQLTKELAHDPSVSENDPRNGIDAQSTGSGNGNDAPQDPSENLQYIDTNGTTDLNPSPNTGAFGNTTSTLRPGNPTPGHATGQGSPAPLRPKNPTPAHASKTVPDRPGAPTPKEAIGTFRHPSIPEQPEQTGGDMRQGIHSVHSNVKDVVGEPRKEPISLPRYFGAGRPGAMPNDKFGQVEEPVRRQILTSSVAGATEKGAMLLGQMRGFELLPKRVDFGVLREGNTYSFMVQLKNVGYDACRFKVHQPPPSTGIKIIFQPGLVAAGMKVDLSVELYAIAVGVPGLKGVGSIAHTLEITSEADHLYLPITAMTSYDYDHRDPKAMPLGFKGPGVKLVSTKPPAGVGIIRPRKDQAIGVQ